MGPSWEVKSEPKSIKNDVQIGLFFGRLSKRIFLSILGPFWIDFGTISKAQVGTPPNLKNDEITLVFLGFRGSGGSRNRTKINVFQTSLWRPLLGGFGARFWGPTWGPREAKNEV